jgi:hypothetical protein
MGTVAAFVGLSPAERAELEWLLESGALGRSANLVKVLRYICEETAAGRADGIKEYSIAVDALGRKPDFDPQSDTIVRVTVHTLRKRLIDFYETGEGSSHAVRVVIPPGGYGAQFLHTPDASLAIPEEPLAEPISEPLPASLPPHETIPSHAVTTPPASRFSWLATAIVLVLAGTAGVWALVRHHSAKPISIPAPIPPVSVNGPVHILLGEGRQAYTDHSGAVWSPASSCEGGESVRSTGASVTGTEDPAIYDGGLRGFVRCTFHAPPGFYEMHLHFAEPTNLEPGERVVNISINAVFNQSVDVVDRAGADHAATTVTIPGISPENDGTIHLDFTSEVSPVNAIEILPAPSVQPLPVRLVAASSPYTDEHGVVWLSDRYFRGGRHSHPPVREQSTDLGLYASGRVGNFEYAIPAPIGRKYRVTLYFREPWLGQPNGTPSSGGSRVFDVYANGEVALRNFNILAEGHGTDVVKTIEHVAPTSQGVINLEFVQVANYPLVNAIEIAPEQVAIQPTRAER